jgi:mRNA-degrading endonuclease RelE of RelBE toxin-antitoxin system
MAQMMLHRDVLKTFGRLPAKVQKKVYELIRKFEEDPKQAGIHLEQLNGMRDAKVRSARVGDDYRAIVIAPDRGDIFLLMHVDHHDEAYQWCRNRQFEAHGTLGTLQVFDVEQAKRAVAADRPTPAVSAAASDYPLVALTDQELYEAGVPQALIPAVRAIHDDQAFTKLETYLPKEASQVLYGVVLGLSLNDALEQMLGDLDAGTSKPSGPGDFSHLAEVTSMDLVMVEGEEHLKEILSEDIEEWRVFLHPYQRKLVHRETRGPMKVFGAAGTGKTVVLMHRAAWLAQHLEPKEKLLLTTFTTNLSVTIESLIEKLAPTVSARIEVTNLHQLARTICHRAGWRGKIAEASDQDELWQQVLTRQENIGMEFDHKFVTEEFRLVVDSMGIDSENQYLTTIRSGRPRLGRKQRKLLWKLFVDFQRGLAKRNLLTFEGIVHQARLVVEQGGFPGYRHVLVDELQDFGLEALRLIATLSPIKQGLGNPLCVVGDGHQRLYNPIPVPLSRAGIDIRGRSTRLKINYRTSEQIRQWAHGLLAGIDVDDLDGGTADTTGDQSVFRGPEPEVALCRDSEQAAGVVISWIRGLLDNGVASHEICVTPSDPVIINVLETNGIPTLELKPRQKDPGHEDPGVRYGSKMRIKGLEFKAVALLHVSDGCEDVRERFSNYVAATRAIKHLLVIRSPKKFHNKPIRCLSLNTRSTA